MNFEELQQAADARMGETLCGVGFRRIAPGTWNRSRGHELNVIQLQKQSAAEVFCVNLGIHYDFLPKAGTEAPWEGDQIELASCEIKLRLTARAIDKDQWWSISEASLNEIATLVQDRALSVFNSYRIPGELTNIDASSVESGDLGPLVSMTKVRACLLLARLHEQLLDRNKCIDFAQTGVKLAGMAVGPKKALKEILKRCERPESENPSQGAG